MNRRSFIAHSCAGLGALAIPLPAFSGRIEPVRGEIFINGERLGQDRNVGPGDRIRTGVRASATLVIGRDAFLTRPDSEVEFQGASRSSVLTGLRLLTGGLLAVFGSGRKTLTTSTATIGIRGTGIYMEASESQTYLCTCYGEVEVADAHGAEKHVVLSGYHAPTMIYAEMTDGAMMAKAEFKNHTDEELKRLEARVGRRPKFSGR